MTKNIKKEVKPLANSEDEEMVEVSIKAIKKGLKQVKLIREGKLKARHVSEFLKEVRNK